MFCLMVLKFPGVAGMGWQDTEGKFGYGLNAKALRPSSYLNKNYSLHFPV